MAYKIFVVDDDLAILRLIKKVLEYEKYEAVSYTHLTLPTTF